MTQYAMIIDLRKCVGCGACALACKTENNTALRHKGQTHNWADFIHQTQGKFPDTTYRTLPVLCNHCTNAPCVAACPVTPKAMYKTPEGITMHNDKRCIGCRACQAA
ncbi:MAG: 4Fe-4S dicluster domain-containing protein, partial [Candidatus Electrothrix sp. AR1]|nr:4Fe-4S dicluster domain-containing protein [Candidatus Electrothrix sp. AR1]